MLTLNFIIHPFIWPSKNEYEIARYLLSKDANTKALDANGKTPIDHIKPEQQELLILFNLPIPHTLVEKSEMDKTASMGTF